jgi:hypothetical protein
LALRDTHDPMIHLPTVGIKYGKPVRSMPVANRPAGGGQPLLL